MPAICDGLRWWQRIGTSGVTRHVAGLTEALLDRFTRLGERIDVYGPRETCDRGGTVAFNLRKRGQLLPYEAVEAAARARGIAIRGGCFCNPGAAEHAFGIPGGRARACRRVTSSIPQLRACLGNSAVGALRASVGVATTLADLDRLLDCLVVVTDGDPIEPAFAFRRHPSVAPANEQVLQPRSPRPPVGNARRTLRPLS
jgi:selenocysteine lyase/cysteine desulfurase